VEGSRIGDGIDEGARGIKQEACTKCLNLKDRKRGINILHYPTTREQKGLIRFEIGVGEEKVPEGRGPTEEGPSITVSIWPEVVI